MEKIRQLTLADRDLISGYLRQHPPVISEQTFTNLYVWRRSRPIWIMEALDSLLILINPEYWMGKGKILLGPPVGPATLKEIRARYNDTISGGVRLSEEFIGDTDPAMVIDDRNNYDYVYKVADLAGLSGRKYSKKRNLIKQCREKYECSFETITGKNIDQCRQMQERWCNDRECLTEPGLFGEYQAIGDILTLFHQLGDLIGGAIRVNGEISAFAIAERLNADTAVWHFEKALPSVHGLSQTVNQTFAENCLDDFEYVNREQDLGIQGLRQAKESYYPEYLVKKFIVTW